LVLKSGDRVEVHPRSLPGDGDPDQWSDTWSG
jgi:hypothetical protein